MDPQLRELVRTLASLTDAEYETVTSEARGPATHQLAVDRKAAASAEMARKAALLTALINKV